MPRLLVALLSVALLSVSCTANEAGPEIARPSTSASEPGASHSPEPSPSPNDPEPRPWAVVWTPGDLPVEASRVMARLPDVGRTTSVTEGLYWIATKRAAQGATVPFEVAHVDPKEYALHIADPTDRGRMRRLGTGGILLSATSRRLRNLGDNGGLTLDGHNYRVAGVISDLSAEGYEGIVATQPPEGWGNRYELIKTSDAARVQEVVRQAMEPTPVAVVGRTRTPYLRYAHSVTPQMFFKQRFGEFSGQPASDGSVIMDPAWRRVNIKTRHVRFLGSVTCHRSMFLQIRGAMRSIGYRNLANLIRPEEFAGCYNPRFIGHDPGGKLSSHTWGAALDINAASNPQGAAPGSNEKLEDVMAKWGFNWGGRWLVPDSMHFEWRD